MTKKTDNNTNKQINFPQSVHIEDIHDRKEEFYDIKINKEINKNKKMNELVYELNNVNNPYQPYYRTKSINDTTLCFESRFESGNLLKAIKINEFEYDLYMRTDINTSRYMQWFYFSVSNTRTTHEYRFNIVNMIKTDALFNYGLKPVIYSDMDAQREGIGWQHDGFDISYYKNNDSKSNQSSFYTLSYSMKFKYHKDRVYMAYTYPYTYSNLRQHLTNVIQKPFVQKDVLCTTLAGNECILLTITNFNQRSTTLQNKRPVILLMARVHPGETVSSHIMKGMIDFLCSDDVIAQKLREKFIFKIIPMINPDGVILGNYRCSLAAVDLNRQWRNPGKRTHPTIYYAKQMLKKLKSDGYKILVALDVHGHTRKFGWFLYGCQQNKKTLDNERILPLMLNFYDEHKKFSLEETHFLMKRGKASTARVVLCKELDIMNSYTLESTFAGTNNYHFTIKDYLQIGAHVCATLLKFGDVNQRQSLIEQHIKELEKEENTDEDIDSSDGEEFLIPKVNVKNRRTSKVKVTYTKKKISQKSHKKKSKKQNSSL